MSNRELETQCPKCGEKFLTEFEEPEAKVIVKQDETKLGEAEAQLKEKDEEVAQFEEQIGELQEKADNFDRLGRLLKSPENFIEFAAHFGYDNLIPPATVAEVAEAESHEEEEELEPTIIAGKKEGWSYLPNLDLSVRE